MMYMTGPGKGGPGDEQFPAPEEDENLLAELRQAVAKFDPPPSSVTEFTLDLLSWRDPDAELAALIADSRTGGRRSGG